jgi:hypothetical protein
MMSRKSNKRRNDDHAYPGGSKEQKKAIATEDHRAHKASIGAPPYMRAKRTPAR